MMSAMRRLAVFIFAGTIKLTAVDIFTVPVLAG
jgi:hypothetical protein